MRAIGHFAPLASDSPPRASRYGVVRDRTRRAPTRRDRPRPRWARPDKPPSGPCQFRLIGQRPRTHRARNLSPAPRSIRSFRPQRPPAQRSARTRRAGTSNPRSCQASLRRSSHGGSRSAPSRAALLARLTSAFADACPLDRALCRLPCRERRGAALRDWSTLLTAHINSVWIRQREFAS